MDRIVLVTAADLSGPKCGGNVNLVTLLGRFGKRMALDIVWVTRNEKALTNTGHELWKQGIKFRSLSVVLQRRNITNYDRLWSIVRCQAPGPAFMERTVGLELGRAVRTRLSSGPAPILHVWGPSLAGCLKRLSVPKLVTFGDCMSALHQSYSRSRPFPLSVYHRLAARGFRRYEREVLTSYSAAVFFTERDRQAVRTNVQNSRLVVIPNGVDKSMVSGLVREAQSIPVVAFHGHYGHYPNVEAAEFLISKVGPYLARVFGEDGFQLRLAGADPEGRMTRLTGRAPWCVYVGYVEDLYGFLRQATVYCAPVFSGAGIKNKVLDALQAGLPVIGTEEAVAGLPAEVRSAVVLADMATFAPRTAEVIAMPPAEAQALADRVANVFTALPTWDDIADSYLALYDSIASNSDTPGAAARSASI